jgi:hypothetical protein
MLSVAAIAINIADATCHARSALGGRSTDGAINTTAIAMSAMIASHVYRFRNIPFTILARQSGGIKPKRSQLAFVTSFGRIESPIAKLYGR